MGQPQASALLSASFSMALVIGPPIAAPLLITTGVQWALVLNAVSFAVSYFCVRAIKVPLAPAAHAPPRESFAAEFRTGLRFFVASRVLTSLGIGIVIATLGTGAINSLAVFFVPRNLHVSASWLGTIAGGEGIGAIVGALLAGRIARRLGPGRLSMVLAGVLASTVLRGFHATVAGVTFGPYDTVFLAGGLLFVIAGIATIAPLSKPAEQAPASEGLAEPADDGSGPLADGGLTSEA